MLITNIINKAILLRNMFIKSMILFSVNSQMSPCTR